MTTSNSSKPSALEAVAGNQVAQAALTVTAAVTGNSLLGAIPALMESLAARRHAQRIDAAILDINTCFEAMQVEVRNISDSQFKVVCESLDALRRTTEEEKIDYLKRAIVNAVGMCDLQSHSAAHLSRILRDMSGDEARFVADNFRYESVALGTFSVDDRTLSVTPNSQDHAVVAGLLSLGLLEQGGEVIGTMGTMRFTPLAAKLLARLLQPIGADYHKIAL